MADTIYIIYKTTNLLNNKIYIGVHQTKNINDGYIGSGIAIKQAIKKYGKCNFNREILYVAPDEFEMYEKEKEIVTEEFVNRRNTYNLIEGGNGGKKLSNETKDKIRNANLGKKLSDETKRKIGLKSLGRNHTQKTKDKISKVKKGHVNSKESIELLIKRSTGKNSHNFSGYYITPWGKFESSSSASIRGLTSRTICRWCKNSNKIISNINVSKSIYLQSIEESPLGKTFKEIGFGFELPQ